MIVCRLAQVPFTAMESARGLAHSKTLRRSGRFAGDGYCYLLNLEGYVDGGGDADLADGEGGAVFVGTASPRIL